MYGRARTPLQRWRDAFRRRQRLWIALYLAAAVGLLGGFAVFGIALQGAERWIDRWNDRWSRRVAACEEAFRAGRIAEVLPELVRIDRQHPARTTLHARDEERERVLTLLGHAWFAVGKKRKCLATFDTLVAFDPLNWRNHFDRAEARRALREPEAALAGYADVLALHPSHWPSVRATIAMHADAGRFRRVVEAYEAYLDAWHLARMRIVVAESISKDEPGDAQVTWIDVPADAAQHRLSIALDLAADWHGEIRLETRGYSVRKPEPRLEPRRTAGETSDASARPPRLVRHAGGRLVEGTFVADDVESELVWEHTASSRGTGRLWLDLTVHKCVDAQTWTRVRTAYRNLVEPERFERARERTRVGGCLEGGSIVRT